jgi:hypothetical protein
MVAIGEKLKADQWPAQHENSIMHVVAPLNKHFGVFPNERPLTEFAVLDSTVDIRHPQVRLIGDIWENSGADRFQLSRIQRLIGIVYRRASYIQTFGMLRKACQDGKIASLSGAGLIGQNFLAGVVAERTPGGSLV